MATKTDRLGLNIWQADDPVTMAGFNENHQILENAVGHAAKELIMEFTVSASAEAVSVPMTGIDWDKYDEVVIDHRLWSDDTSNGLAFRVNNSTDTGQHYVYFRYNSGDSSHSEGRIGHTYANARLRRMRFKVFNNAASPISLMLEHEHTIGFGSWISKTYQQMETLTISPVSTGKKVQAGGTMKIWGVRG